MFKEFLNIYFIVFLNFIYIIGDGIGKTNKGISVPVKASMKFNNNGVIYR
mgnify:CR=1 FL=1